MFFCVVFICLSVSFLSVVYSVYDLNSDNNTLIMLGITFVILGKIWYSLALSAV